MPPMRALLLAVIGTVFTTLLLLLPALWGHRRLGLHIDATALAALALPFAVLPFALRPRASWLALWAWPSAHLPALALVPGLADASLAAGDGDLRAVASVAASGAAWFAIHLWPPPPDHSASTPSAPRRRPHPLTLATFALTSALTAVFWSSALADPGVEPLAANLTLLAGAAVTAFIALRSLGTDLADTLLDPQLRRRQRAALLLPVRPSAARLAWTLLAAAALTLLTLAR